MRRYVSEWVEDNAESLANRLREIGERDGRIISVMYRPIIVDPNGDLRRNQPAMFVVVSEFDWPARS
jgi:hypothetical protein